AVDNERRCRYIARQNQIIKNLLAGSIEPADDHRCRGALLPAIGPPDRLPVRWHSVGSKTPHGHNCLINYEYLRFAALFDDASVLRHSGNYTSCESHFMRLPPFYSASVALRAFGVISNHFRSRSEPAEPLMNYLIIIPKWRPQNRNG